MYILIYFLLIVNSLVFCEDNHGPMPDTPSPADTQQATPPPNRKMFGSDIFGRQIHQKSFIGYGSPTANIVDILYENQKQCYETEMLMDIVMMVLRLIKDDPITNVKLPVIYSEIIEMLRSTPTFGTASVVYDQLLKLEDILHDDQPLHFINDIGFIRTPVNHDIDNIERINTKIVFKSEIPHINQPTCKLVFLNLLQRAYENYMNLLQYNTCESISSYSEELNILPITLPFTKEDNNAYKLVDTDRLEHKYEMDGLLNMNLHNDKIINVKPYKQYIYKLPSSKYISQIENSYINQLNPEDKAFYIIPDTEKHKKDIGVDSYLQISNIYNIAGAHSPKNIYEVLLKYPGQREYILNTYYNAKLYAPYTLNTADYYQKLDEILSVITGLKRLDTSIVSEGDIVLTYVVKQPETVIYQPHNYVKYRLPYKIFMESVNKILLIKPYLRAHPLELYNEVIVYSNLSEISPGLRDLPRDKIIQLTQMNGRLVNTQVLPVKIPFNINVDLRPVHDLNSGVNAGKYINSNKDYTEGNQWNDFDSLNNNVNNMATNPLQLQKRYSIVNNIPQSGYDIHNVNGRYLINEGLIPVHDLNSGVNAGKYINSNKDYTEGNQWNDFDSLNNNVNNIATNPLQLQKRYSIVNNIPQSGYDIHNVNGGYLINEGLIPVHDLNSGVNAGKYIDSNKGYTEGNQWNDFDSLNNNVNNMATNPLQLQKRYSIVNNIPQSGYDIHNVNGRYLINEGLIPVHDLNSGVNAGKYIDSNKGYTEGNQWNDFDSLNNNVNNMAIDPLQLQKRYSIVNNIPQSGYYKHNINDRFLRTHYLNETVYNKIKDPKNIFPFQYGR